MTGRFFVGFWLAFLPLCSCSDSTTESSETPVDIARKIHLSERNENLVDKDDPVAMFVFSQFADDTIRLTIENIVSDNVTFSFAFEVRFQPQVVGPATPPWDNQGAVTNLAQGQIADAGIIAVSATPVSMGEIVIDILGDITYKQGE